MIRRGSDLYVDCVTGAVTYDAIRQILIISPTVIALRLLALGVPTLKLRGAGGEQKPAPVQSTEPIPIAAAAALSGIFAFLSDLQSVSSRRASIQVRRSLTDANVLSRFGTHWLQVCPAPFQVEHDAFHATIAEHFQLAAPGASDQCLTGLVGAFSSH